MTVGEKPVSLLELAIPVYAAAIPSMIALCVAAFLANVIVLLSMKSIRVPFNLTLKMAFSLSAADAWTSVIIVVGLVANSYLPIVKSVPKFHRQDCIVYALEAMRLGGMVTSVFHLLVLCLAHYGAIAHPITYRNWTFNRLRINAVLTFVWVTPPLGFMILFFAYFDETFNAEICDGGRFLNKIGFRLSVFLVMFIPLTFMTFVYIKIVTLLSALKFNSNSSRSSTASSQRRQNYFQRKVRTVVTGLLIVSTFLIGWIPSSVLFALTCESCLYPHEKLLAAYPRLAFTLNISVNCLIIIKGLLNPLIYCIRIPEINEALRITYHCCLFCFDKRKKASTISFELSTYGEITLLNGTENDTSEK